MPQARLEVPRTQVLAHRRRVAALDERRPSGTSSLRRAAWAGLQDSMPRAALLSIHARVAGTGPDALDDPSLTQVWGPRFQVYVVAERDVAPFTLGRLPDGGAALQRAQDTAARLRELLGDEELRYGDAGRALGVHHNSLRYAAPTGAFRLRWDGARQPTIRAVTPPDVDPLDARLDLARRYLHVFGPTTAASFARWAGIKRPLGEATFDALVEELVAVRTPIGDAWVLAADEDGLRAEAGPTAPARLLPSGDSFFLLHDADRELLVPDAARRDLLWTSRVWPGALLLDGEVAGTWRRAQHRVTVAAWRRLTAAERATVEAEAVALPLPGLDREVVVDWSD